jgi:3-oxo-5-alpha-steroid 4-dehydrogenase 1
MALSAPHFHTLILAWIALAPVVFVLLFFVNAPYGRFVRSGWGPVVSARLGWFLMETPSWAMLSIALLTSGRRADPVALVLFALWVGHYIYRSAIYPLTLSPKAHPWPWLVVGMGACFNFVNGYVNGQWLFVLGPERGVAWFCDPRFLGGLALFFAGIGINIHSDRCLRREKDAAGGGYVVPQSGLHRLVASPNYLGEVVEWCGWALAAWSLPALSFVVWSVANLAPRASASRRWYRATFADYPRSRRRMVPWIW